MNEEIKKYVIDFFERHEADDAYICMARIKELFDVPTNIAYSYVAKYLSEKWEITE